MGVAVDRWAGESEQRVTMMLSDRVARAFLMEGESRAMALDFNARLVTALRLAKVWPALYRVRR